LAQPIVNHLAKLVGLIGRQGKPAYRNAQEVKWRLYGEAAPFHGWRFARFNEPIDQIGQAMHNPRTTCQSS
jgi:hypothetical protein